MAVSITDDKEAWPFESTFSSFSIAIWNTMMGTSLMTMPWAFGQAGFVGGIIIMLAMAGIALYTATRLLTLQKTMGKIDLSSCMFIGLYLHFLLNQSLACKICCKNLP